jgi:hypothetical protein
MDVDAKVPDAQDVVDRTMETIRTSGNPSDANTTGFPAMSGTELRAIVEQAILRVRMKPKK